MEADLRTLQLADGRLLGYHEYGDPEGKPVFFLHGSGSGAGAFGALLDSAARSNGLRLLAPDRPGIGGSSDQPGRTLGHWPRDLSELTAALGLKRFGLISYSGGSPYAFACAEAMGEDVAAMAVVSGLCPLNAPYDRQGIPPAQRLMLALMRRRPQWFFRMMFTQLLKGTEDEERFYAAMAKRAAAAERPILMDPAYRRIAAASTKAAFQQGLDEAIADISLCFGPWEIGPAKIKARVAFWHGEADGSAPPAMARYLHGLLPQSELHVLPGDGHLSALCHHTGEIMADLARKI